MFGEVLRESGASAVHSAWSFIRLPHGELADLSSVSDFEKAGTSVEDYRVVSVPFHVR